MIRTADRDHVATFLLWLFFLGFALDISSFAMLRTSTGVYEVNAVPAALTRVSLASPFVLKVLVAALALWAAAAQTRPRARHVILFFGAAGCLVGAITNGVALSAELARAL